MIVVTAPTSRIGTHVVRALLAERLPVRVVARDPQRVPTDMARQVEVVTGSHADPAVVTQAFKAADAVFWLVPADPAAASVEAAYTGFARAGIEALTTCGVQRVVGISALGRGTPVAGRAGHVTATLAMDDLIAATGVPYRALTNPSFMHNLLAQVGAIRNQGTIYGPTPPDLALPMVAARDIAAVAVRLLTATDWTGTQEVPVLGPEDLTQNQVAAVTAEVLDRPVHYQQVSLEQYRQTMLRVGHSTAMAQAMVDMAAAKNAGLDLAVPRTPIRTTPTSYRQWCTETLKPAVLS